MRNTIITKFIFAAILALSLNQAVACSCMPAQAITEADYKGAGEIFTGRVLKVETSADGASITATFEVSTYLKSKTYSKQATVITASSSAACGLNFNVGEEWYIFGSTQDDNKTYAGLCGRSIRLGKPEAIKEYSRQDRKMYKKSWKKDKRRFKADKKFIARFEKAKKPQSPAVLDDGE